MAALMSCLLVAPMARGDATAAAAVERAKGHFRAGDTLYKAGQYAEALVEFEAGYKVAPRPEFLLNLGQVHRKLRHYAAAIDMFEKFLASASMTDPHRAEVESVLVELREENVAQAPAPAPVTPPPPVAPVVQVATTPPPPPPRREWLAPTLLGVGVAVAAGGAGMVGYAVPAIADANQDLERYERARSAVPLRIAGAVLLGTGGALIIGGIVRYATRRHR